MTFLGLTDPSPTELAVAGQVQMNLEQRFGPLVYSRPDLIGGHAGELLVVEVEVIDPNLSLSLFPARPTPSPPSSETISLDVHRPAGTNPGSRLPCAHSRRSGTGSSGCYGRTVGGTSRPATTGSGERRSRLDLGPSQGSVK